MISAPAASFDVPGLVSIGVVGLLVGSFLNVVIHRVPIMIERADQPEGAAPYNLAVPPSACPACGARVRPLDNIPVLSWLRLGGRCADCGAAISVRYPSVEIAGGVIAAAAAFRFGVSPAFAAAAVFAWFGLAIAMIDVERLLIPDLLVLPLLWVGLLVNVSGLFAPVGDAVVGAAAGYLLLGILHWGGPILLKRDLMGRGDLKLFAAIGAWLGWRALFPVLFLACLSGAAIGIARLAFPGTSRTDPLPFGPFLILGGVAVLGWGDALARLHRNVWGW